MKIKLLVFSLIILFSFLVLLQKTEARKGALFCVCTKNCGGGVLQCLYPGGKLVNEGKCNTQKCKSNCDVTKIVSCSSCSKSCGGGTKTCENQCGSTGTYVCNRQSCGESGPVCGSNGCETANESTVLPVHKTAERVRLLLHRLLLRLQKESTP